MNHNVISINKINDFFLVSANSYLFTIDIVMEILNDMLLWK